MSDPKELILTASALYRPRYGKDGNLAHSVNCKMVFGRFDPLCPRCQQMMHGAPARTSWQAEYHRNKARQKAARSSRLKFGLFNGHS